jgi:formylglycine-generating enzyme
MAHASRRADGRVALVMMLGTVSLAGCELWVGIPHVKLASDGSGDGGASGQCARSADGGVRAGSDMVRIDSTLGSYCIDATEVTVSQFNAFIIATGGSLAGTPAACTTTDGGAVMTPPVDNTPGDQNLPIGNLGECHAWAYCAWAGKRLCGAIGDGGSTVGVPKGNTEWTYACINGTQNLDYSYGSSYDAQACNVDSAGPVPVASKSGCKGTMAPFDQIYDMVGNVWEFVNDFGTNGDSVAPQGGSYSNTEQDFDSGGGGCHFEKGFNGVIFDFQQSGIRCCADLAP